MNGAEREIILAWFGFCVVLPTLLTAVIAQARGWFNEEEA